MTIDERLERLTERHQALAESVEMFIASTQANFTRVGSLVEKLEGRIDQLTERVETLAESVDTLAESTAANFSRVGHMIEQLVGAVQQTNDTVATLMTVAESHQRRISDLEAAQG